MTAGAWLHDDIPRQDGRVVVITGANSGIGLSAAQLFAGRGASVILAVRDAVKGQAAREAILRQHAGANVATVLLDLTDLQSVRDAAAQIQERYPRLDILINNAGIMMCPYARTRDGFEIQIGTNHFGHFALSAALYPLLRATAGSRLVVVASQAHRGGRIDFDDIQWQRRRYRTMQAYCDSKLANLYFTYELVRRQGGQAAQPLVCAAHPGWTATALQQHTPLFSALNRFFAQDVMMGALPTLRAACDEQAQAGDYFGPAYRMEMQGPARKVTSTPRSHDIAAAQRLWQLSQELTHSEFVVN